MRDYNIFISYSWKDKDEVDKIDKDFQAFGITFTRDERDLSYHGSIKEFMKRVRKADYALMVISDTYLKSRNCMYEVMEFIKDEDYKDRILHIILDNCKDIFTPAGRAKYVAFWEGEYNKTKEAISSLDPINADDLYKDLKVIENICRNISGFISTVSDMLCVPLDDLKAKGYKPILDFIEPNKETAPHKTSESAAVKASGGNTISGGVFNNTTFNQGCNIGNQTNNYYIENPEKSDKDTSGFIITEGTDVTPTQYFVGRESELETLREQVRSEGKLVLVSGMGGIGKTHLCRKLYKEYVDNHKKGKETGIDHIGYLNYTGSMDDTLINGLKYNKTGNYEEDVQAAWRKLGDMASDKKLLVIIDNVNTEMHKDVSLKKLHDLTCAIFLTSRLSSFGRFETLKIGTLPLDKCRDIFRRIYGETNPSEQEDLDYILSELAARHTKTVELLAHTAKNKRWKVARLRQELIEKHFNLSYISEGNKTTLQSEYEKLFDLTGLSEKEINVLEAYSILPPLPITADICNEFFNEDAGLCEDDEIFNILYEKGWLDGDETSFSMHPVIAEVISARQQPVIASHLKLAETCGKYITCAATEVFTKALPFMPFAEAIAEKLHDGSSKIIGYLSNQIGFIYVNKGEYDKALVL